VGRFTQPDTIVPTSTQGTQAWDRYAYVNNNPVRYTDPSGHFGKDNTICLDDGWCGSSSRGGGPVSLIIPKKIDNFLDIKDDPIELIARAILGEQAGKLFTDKEDDAVGVAWAIRNRYEKGIYFDVDIDGSRTAHGEYSWYWSANSEIYGMQTLRAHDPLNSGYWKTREDAIRAYIRAREIAKQVLSADKSQDITHGAVRWADQGLRQGENEFKWGPPLKTYYGSYPNCLNCIQYNRTHFDDDWENDKNSYNPYRTSWCVSTVPLSECQE
jgi:hypothetical protein